MIRYFILTVVLSLFSAQAFAAPATFEENFRDGVDALRSKEFSVALKKLERARKQKDDPRLYYYLGFAHEKIGNCLEAKSFYGEPLRDERSAFALREASRKALDGFEARCPTSRTVRPIADENVEAKTSASAAGFVTLGWITTVLGGLTLIGIPVKRAVEDGTTSDVEDYFSVRYQCDVDRGEIPATCDADEIRADPAYPRYAQQIDRSKSSTTAMAIGGGIVLGAGVITLVTVLIANAQKKSSKKSRTQIFVGPNRASIRVSF